jgi:hypothetical protein
MTSYPPPYPSSPPPPPPLGAFEQEDVPTPPIAWLVPLAALLAVIGAFLPWFHGNVSVPGRGSRSFQDSLYSYADGRIGLLPPITLVVLSISVIGLLRGKTPRRFTRGSSGPVVSAARGALIIGGVSLVCVIIAWFLVPTQYKFTEQGQKVSWNDELDRLHAAGVDASFSRGPQVGYFLTIAAAVLAVVAGALMLLLRSKAGGPAQVAAYPPPAGAYPPPGPQQWNPQPGPQQWGQPPPPGYGQQPGYAQQPGYGAPPAYGQQPGYGAPQQGFGAPSTYGTPAAERPEGPIDLSK